MQEEDLELLADLRSSQAGKLLRLFQEETSQRLKETALLLQDEYIEIQRGERSYTHIETVKEQLRELQGRQNMLIAEIRWLKDCSERYLSLKEGKKGKRKARK